MEEKSPAGPRSICGRLPPGRGALRNDVVRGRGGSQGYQRVEQFGNGSSGAQPSSVNQMLSSRPSLHII